MNKKRVLLASDQRGMVSIIVTMVLIIVMTLVVLAMSQNSNREQRQALDRQLSDQAFYNAESGINDWASYLYSHDNAPPIKTDCATDAAAFPGAPSPTIGTDGLNSYSCILYNKAPTTLEYDSVGIADSIVTPIEPVIPAGDRMQQMQFTWRAADGSTGTGSCNLNTTTALPASLPGGCDVGGLRIDLINPSNFVRDTIARNNFPAYLLPRNGSGSGNLTYAAGTVQNQGVIGIGFCTGGECKLTISGLSIRNGERYYLHMKGLYKTVNVTIRGCHSNGAACTLDPSSPAYANQAVNFNSSQIEIDSTGKANDVLRRVKVRLPVQSQVENAGDFALKTTQSVCKLITVSLNQANEDSRCL